MDSHFDAIGFAVDDEESFARLASDAAEHGEEIAAEGGGYVRWAPGGGAELWAQIVGGEITGLNPHFDGAATMRVAVTREKRDRRAPALDATLRGWANPEDDDPTSGDFEFFFDVPDLRAGEQLRLPALAEVGLVIFADVIDAYADERAWAEDHEGEGPDFAPESWLAVGGFGSDTMPPATNIVHGTVLETSVRENGATGLPFTHARLRTLGGEVDVVAAAADVEVAPTVGGIVQVTGWTSGRIRSSMPLPGRRRGLFGRRR